MSRKLFLVVTTIIFCGLGTVLSPRSANADVPLRKATIQDLIRQVRLIREKQAPRPAVRGASMTLGDALSTARSSRADVRFNDGSLTRLGELALFRFTPESRNFYLSNGTMLLLIPPNRGRTNVNTPNASAGIRGSALFVRYDAATDTTVIGALTDNPNGPMDILNKDGSQRQALKSGQMVIIVRDRIQKLYEFDLKTFYETSELVKGLDLTKEQGATSDADIAGVQAETSEAFKKQADNPIQGELTQAGYVALSAVKSEYYEETQSVANSPVVKPSPTISTPETVYKDGVQQPIVKQPETPITPQPPITSPNPNVSDPTPNPPPQQPGTPIIPLPSERQPIQVTPNPTPPVVPNPTTVVPPVTPTPNPTTVVSPVQPPAPAPNPAPAAPPTQQYQPPQSIPNPPAAVVTPPAQAPAPTPIQAPVTPPVQAPTIIPTPTQAPVVPPTQPTQPPQFIPPAAVQPPATQRTPATTPQPIPTLAPALAPAATPESPATTRQLQQPVR